MAVGIVALVGGKAFDANWLVAEIPSKSNWKIQRDHDKEMRK